MSFLDNLDDIIILEEEVTHFEIYESGYYALLRRGDRLDITRVFHAQPPIEDTEHYYAFMFVEAKQGFFLMRQPVLEGRAHEWEVYLELKPAKPWRFFQDTYSYWCEIRKRQDSGA